MHGDFGCWVALFLTGPSLLLVLAAFSSAPPPPPPLVDVFLTAEKDETRTDLPLMRGRARSAAALFHRRCLYAASLFGCRVNWLCRISQAPNYCTQPWY